MVGLITRQIHTLRLAIARLPIRLLGPWLDTVQPRRKDAYTRPASPSRRHIPESFQSDAGCLFAFLMVGLIPRHFQSVTPCDSPSYLSCLSDRFGHCSYLSHSGLGAPQCVRQVVVTCYEYYAKCLAFSIRQSHTLRLAIAHLPIRLLDPWLDTVQPRPTDAYHASGKSSSHPGVPSL
jgi:hypothetical protein